MEKMRISEFTDKQNCYGFYCGYILHIKMKEMSNISIKLDNGFMIESQSTQLIVDSTDLGLRFDILYPLIRKITVFNNKETIEIIGW